MKFEAGKVTLSAILTATLVAGGILATNLSTTNATSAGKVYVCKYVGTPGVDETLQTGNNPIEVSVNALPNNWYVGGYFNDNQGRSYVLATSPQTPEPDIDDCPRSQTTPTPTPVVTQSPTPTATPSSTPSASATPSATPVVTPTATPTQTSVATDTPRETQTPVSTPNGDVCTNIDGVQTSLPGSNWYFVGEGSTICREFEYGGPNGSTGNSNGQVLGASTMAATGSFAETIYQAIMGLGGLITAKGIKKAKTSKKK